MPPEIKHLKQKRGWIIHYYYSLADILEGTYGLWILDYHLRFSALTTLFTRLNDEICMNDCFWVRLWKLSWGKQRDSDNKESAVVEAVICAPAGLPLIQQGSRLKAETMTGDPVKARMNGRLMKTEQKVINSLQTHPLLVLLVPTEFYMRSCAPLIHCDQQLGISPQAYLWLN